MELVVSVNAAKKHGRKPTEPLVLQKEKRHLKKAALVPHDFILKGGFELELKDGTDLWTLPQS